MKNYKDVSLTDVYILIPIPDRKATDSKFKRQNNSPLEDVVPTHGKTPGRIDEASRVGIETTGNREHDSELAKGVDDVEHHDTDDHEIDKERSRAAVVQGLAGTDEETSTDGAADGNHVQVAGLHGALDLGAVAGVIPARLEGVEVETISRHEVLPWEVLGNAGLIGGRRGRGGDMGLLVVGPFFYVGHDGWFGG